MTSLRRFFASTSFVAFVSASTSAFAQYAVAPALSVPPPPPGESESVPLRLESDTPNTHYKVFPGRREKVPWFECLAPCAYSVPRGEYRIEASGPDISSGKTVVAIATDTEVVTHGRSSDGKTTGLVLGITGSALFGVGLLGMMAVAMGSGFSALGEDHRTAAQIAADDRNTRNEMIAFGIVTAVGAALAVGGWIEFGTDRTKVEASPTPRPRIVSFGVAPTGGGGAAIGLQGAF